ncbi:ABC transporter substrate-binding protein [Salinarimonas sp.]|uniref:ABC transporter substrate-binding protein n=1 Tax=Salinarimonas sp. TaxID=2766526 RepID=UPI0032D99425
MTTKKHDGSRLDRDETTTLEAVHPQLPQMAEDVFEGKVSRRAFLRTATLLGLSAGAAYAMAGKLTGEPFAPAARAQDGTPVKGGVLRVSMNIKEISDPATVDWSEKGNELRHVIEPLVRITSDNVAVPHLAESWTASEDLRTWTFKLRQGVKWSNGDDFGADDVVANFKRWMDPAVGSSNYGRFSALRTSNDDGSPMLENGVVKIDDHTVEFNLRVPFLALPESMGDYPALIAHRSFQGGNWVEDPIGTGPFELVELTVGSRARYRRKESGWWGGEVHLDGIDYIDHGDDPAAPLAALASGQVDILYRLNVEQVPAARAIPSLVLYQADTAQTGVARMKVTEAPFDDVRVRQAIQSCIDHERLLAIAYQGLGVAGEDHHVAPVHPEYAALPKPTQDYDRARALLAEAGYADGLEIQIDCVAQPTWEPNTCQALVEMLRPAGIDLAVNIMPGGTYWDRWMTTPFGFTSWTHRPLGTQVLSLAYRSGVPWNESSYSNPDFDALLDKAEATLDVTERQTIMEELELMLQGDAVIIQPYWRSIATASNQKVQGYAHHPAEEHHFEQVWLAQS